MREKKIIGGHNCHLYGEEESEIVLRQSVDDHDLNFLASELSIIKESVQEPVLLVAFQVERRNHDL